MIETSHELPPSPKVEFITLSKDLYAPGTVGEQFFPELLEGRLRPNIFVNYVPSFGNKTNELLTDMGINNMDDLMNVPLDQIDSLPTYYKNNIYQRASYSLDKIAESHAITPQGRLIGRVLGERQGPVPAEDEDMLRKTVNDVTDAFSSQNESYKKAFYILILRYGLDDDQLPKTLNEVSNIVGLSRERVRQLETRACRILGDPKYLESDLISPLSALPLGTIGRELGITYRKDIPPMPINIKDLNLSEETFSELYKNCSETFRTLRLPLRYSELQLGFTDAEIEQNKITEFKEIMNFNPGDLISPQASTELFDKVSQKFKQNIKPHKVFGNLLPEISNIDNPSRLVLQTPVNGLSVFSEQTQRWLSKNTNGNLGALIGLTIDKTNTNTENPAPNFVSQEIKHIFSLLDFYLEEITDQAEDF